MIFISEQKELPEPDMVSGKDVVDTLEWAYYFWPALIIFLIIYFLFTYQYSLWRITTTLSWIRKPPTLPVVGNAFYFLGKSATERWRRSMDLLDCGGGIAQVWIMHRPTVLVSKKHVAERLLKGTGDTLTKKSEHYSFISDITGKSLLSLSAMEWITRRKLLTPFFNEDEGRYILTTHHHAKALVSYLDQKMTQSDVFDIQHYARLSSADLASDVLMMAFPNFLQQSEQPYLKAVKMVGEIVSYRSRTPLYNWKSVYQLTKTKALQMKSSAAINSFINKAVLRRRKAKQNNEEVDQSAQGKEIFLDYLLDKEDKKLLNENDVQNEMNAFLFAAHETVGAGIGFTIYLLGLHLDIQERVAKEINDAMSGDSIDISKLELLDRCLKEALRLYPPVPWIGRYLKNYIRIEGNNWLPEGANVMINSYKLHRDPDIFPNPEQFNPERPEPPEFAYLPFGAGWRSCIGQKWAINQMKIILAYILKTYCVKSLDKPEHLELEAEVLLKSANGLRVHLHKRQ